MEGGLTFSFLADSSRMLKVDLVPHPHPYAGPPTPSHVHETDSEDASLLNASSISVSAYFEEAQAPHTADVSPRTPTHIGYGTFGTFTAPHAPPVDNGYPGLGIGFPSLAPSTPTPKPRRPSRPMHGLTVQVPAVPLESVRRHVAEMLFNIRTDGDGDDSSHAPSSPLARTDSRYSIESRRSRPSIDSPVSPRFPGVVVTPAESENVSVVMSMTMSSPNVDILATPITPATPLTPATPYNFANHPSIEAPLGSAAKYRRHSDETPRQYRLDDTPRPVRQRTRSDTPPRGRQRARGAPRPRRDSISTHTDDTEDGVVYKQIGLSGLPGRKRHIHHGHRKKVRIEE